MYSREKENKTENNDPLSKLPPNFNIENNINNNNENNNPLKSHKQLMNPATQYNQDKGLNNQIKLEPNQNLNKKITPSINKKPRVNSILKTNNNAFDFDLKSLNDVNKKYTLFEDVALEKIYEDIQKDLKNNFASDSLNLKNPNSNEKANYPGIVYIKKKTNESGNKQVNLVNNPVKVSKEIEKNKANNNNDKLPPANKLNSNLMSNENSNFKKPILPLNNNNFNYKKGVVKEEDLFLAMTKRLNVVEAQLKENKYLLDKKTQENIELNVKLDEMKIKLNDYENWGKQLKNSNVFNDHQLSEEEIDFENPKVINKNDIGCSQETLNSDVYTRPKTTARIKSASSVNKANLNARHSSDDNLKWDIANESEQCPNCPKLNKLVDDLYKFMNNLISFMHEQGFKFENMDYFKDLNRKKINDLSNQLFPIEESEKENSLGAEQRQEKNYSSLPKFKLIKSNNPLESNEKNNINNNIDNNKSFQSSETQEALNIPKEIDIAVITRRIEELNMLIIKDNDHTNFELDKSENVYKLKHRKEIKIGFYKNGIAIENFPFYAYSSIESQRILSDILDGYSPYIFKDKYPKGVLLQVQNKVNAFYENSNANGFGGNTGNAVQGLFDIKCVQKLKLTKDQFLSRLPNTILKDGKVYNIREDLSNIISGGKEDRKLNDLIFGTDGELNDNCKEKVTKKELIDYSVDRIEEINVYEIDQIKEDFYNENKAKKNYKDLNSFLETLRVEDEVEIINNQICKFKITIPILNGKNIILNLPKKKFVKEVFEELLDLIRKCSKLPKYKLMLDWSLVSIDKDNFTLVSTFPRKAFNYDHQSSLEENKLYPTSVFIFEEKKKV